MKVLIQSILDHLVDNPKDIRISEIAGDKTLVFEVECKNGDAGKIIGRNGKTIAAIRTILSTAASREGKKAVLEVVK